MQFKLQYNFSVFVWEEKKEKLKSYIPPLSILIWHIWWLYSAHNDNCQIQPKSLYLAEQTKSNNIQIHISFKNIQLETSVLSFVTLIFVFHYFLNLWQITYCFKIIVTVTTVKNNAKNVY